MKLIRNATVYAPQPLGQQDLLLAGDKIVHLAPSIAGGFAGLPVEEIDASGQLLLPGLIDQHVHVIGAGGEGGFRTRTPEVQISNIVRYGITTIVCLRGTDGTTRGLEALYAKAQALEEEGLSTYLLTGSFEVPVDTLTGSVRRDLVLIDKVIGVKTAISDRRSSQPTRQELERLAAEAYTGGLVGGKKGYTHIHMGAGPRKLELILEIVQETELPIYLFIPTHVNRDLALFEQAKQFAKLGGIIDLTSGIGPEYGLDGSLKASQALKQCLEEGVPLENITMSSDANGSMVIYDERGNAVRVFATTVESLLQELQDMVLVEGIALETALPLVTSNVAQAIGVYPQKGQIAVGSDADLLLVDQKLQIQAVYAKGKQVADATGPLVQGLFENSNM